MAAAGDNHADDIVLRSLRRTIDAAMSPRDASSLSASDGAANNDSCNDSCNEVDSDDDDEEEEEEDRCAARLRQRIRRPLRFVVMAEVQLIPGDASDPPLVHGDGDRMTTSEAKSLARADVVVTRSGAVAALAAARGVPLVCVVSPAADWARFVVTPRRLARMLASEVCETPL